MSSRGRVCSVIGQQQAQCSQRSSSSRAAALGVPVQGFLGAQSPDAVGDHSTAHRPRHWGGGGHHQGKAHARGLCKIERAATPRGDRGGRVTRRAHRVDHSTAIAHRSRRASTLATGCPVSPTVSTRLKPQPSPAVVGSSRSTKRRSLAVVTPIVGNHLVFRPSLPSRSPVVVLVLRPRLALRECLALGTVCPWRSPVVALVGQGRTVGRSQRRRSAGAACRGHRSPSSANVTTISSAPGSLFVTAERN